MTTPVDDAGLVETAEIEAQVVVSVALTLMKLGFVTSHDGARRAWFMSLQQSPTSPPVPVRFVVDGSIFGAAVAISHGDVDPNHLAWKLADQMPFVRMLRQPSNHLLVAVEVPVSRNPPYLMPDVVQTALNTVFSAVMLLVNEYPDRVRPEPLESVALSPAMGGEPAVTRDA